MCKGFCRIFNISLHRIAYFSLVSSDVSSDCEQTTKNRRTYRKPKILIRYQVKFLVFYMFSGFLLFGHNHDFDFLNKIYFSGTLWGVHPSPASNIISLTDILQSTQTKTQQNVRLFQFYQCTQYLLKIYFQEIIKTGKVEEVAKSVGATAFIETSAKTKENVQTLFETAAREAYKAKMQRESESRNCVIIQN